MYILGKQEQNIQDLVWEVTMDLRYPENPTYLVLNQPKLQFMQVLAQLEPV